MSRGGISRFLLLAGLVLGAGCMDVASPHGGARRVSLSVYPMFDQAGIRDGAADADSFVIVISNPPFAPDTVSRVIPPGQDTIQISVSIFADAGQDTVFLQLDGYNSSTVPPTHLYSGTTSVLVQAGLPGAASGVQVLYVGPGRRLKALAVAPTSASLAPGGSQQFSVTATDSSDAVMAPDSAPVRWISRDTNVLLVNQHGLAQAIRNGTTYVVVKSVARSSVKDSAQVVVANVNPPLLGLNPTSAAFTDTVGTSNPADKTINVVNTGGGSITGLAVGTIQYGAGASGWLTGGLTASAAPTVLTLHANITGISAGHYTATVPVTAAGVGNSPQNVTVTLDLTASPLASVAVAPGVLGLFAGDTTTLTLTGKNAVGATVPVVGATFASRSTGVATVNPATGKITAVASGTSVIVVNAGAGISDSMLVAVGSNGHAVASAIADGKGFDRVLAGDTVVVRVAVDLRGFPDSLGSYNAELDWNTSQLHYVSAAVVAGGFMGPVINSLNVAAGQLKFGAADASATSHGAGIGLLDVKFTAGVTGNTSVTLLLTDLTAARSFTNMLTNALIVSGAVHVQ